MTKAFFKASPNQTNDGPILRPTPRRACAAATRIYRIFLIFMPELPEVEVTRRGVAPHLEGRVVEQVVLRREGLRWPFPARPAGAAGRPRILHRAARQIPADHFEHGTLIVHLGMSGHLRVLPPGIELKKHDHFDLVVDGPTAGACCACTIRAASAPCSGMRNDDGELDAARAAARPRRRAAGRRLFGRTAARATRKRSAPIKQVLLAGDIVVGVGNIYACESLFRAGINPKTPAGAHQPRPLRQAGRGHPRDPGRRDRAGRQHLRDFIAVNGQSGYFQQTYFVYDRAGVPCRNCGAPVRQIKQGQRSTFYCATCQR
jgi:formamidopyrimidine-DNA glycosylase